MLRELRIQNIAVIEQADISFKPGLNVLTGETGAGKSIIIDSISAVTGARVNRELVRSGADHGTVTAVFRSESASQWLAEQEIDADDGEIILQRRISADGKSSCRVNGVPVSTSQLRDLGDQLLELHGQNEGLRLIDERKHLSLLDRFSGLSMTEYQKAFRSLLDDRSELERLQTDQTEKEHLQIVLSETIAELERASVQKGEQQSLQEKRELLRNSGKLKESLQAARQALSSDEGALNSVQLAAYHCRRASAFSGELIKAADELEQADSLLADADEILRDFEDNLNFSEEEYNELEQRLHDLSRLERKYRMTADDLPDYLESCRTRINELMFSEDNLRKLSQKIREKELLCRREAEQLHRQREAAAQILGERVEKELHELSMPYARFAVELDLQSELKQDGLDTARFLLSANKGEAPGRISRIASGGELSRIMLALKNVFSLKDPVPTLIFDEIDTGVSGIAAQRVGEKLASLSVGRQVLCVTHLPQIAVMADHHFVIEKEESGERTATRVEALNREGVLKELARLNGGSNVTDTTLRSAEEQLHYAELYKNHLRGE